MRMFPNRYEDPRIGIGDWYAANLADPHHGTGRALGHRERESAHPAVAFGRDQHER